MNEEWTLIFKVNITDDEEVEVVELEEYPSECKWLIKNSKK